MHCDSLFNINRIQSSEKNDIRMLFFERVLNKAVSSYCSSNKTFFAIVNLNYLNRDQALAPNRTAGANGSSQSHLQVLLQ